MNSRKPLVLLVQLPIPPPGPGDVEGNVPLAAAYLKLFARRQGLEELFAIELLPPELADRLGDQGLIAAILDRQPCMVGFTCYIWNVERSLWIARRLKEARPDVKILLGGPEITADNTWVLGDQTVDYFVLGEGEVAFAALLAKLSQQKGTVPFSLQSCTKEEDRHSCLSKTASLTRKMTDRNVCPPDNAVVLGPLLESLDAVSSPYIENILDLPEGGRMLLETARGCRFRCKYCYYPKGNDSLRFLSDEQILASLRYAVARGASEVVLLDPTLNQRPHFADFLRLLRRGNEEGRLAFSGELRAEGIDAEAAKLLREAGFHEVEIGLQSVEPRAWQLMGRRTNLAGFERGVKLLLDEGIKVQVDLILGLPGDSVDSVRRGIDFLVDAKSYSQAQMFNLSILPGTAFRREAEQLGLKYQAWPPYYALKTPTLDLEQMLDLMDEAEEAFGVDFDPLPPPSVGMWDEQRSRQDTCCIDLDAANSQDSAEASSHSSLAFTLRFRSANFHERRREAAEQIARLLAENPHTTLQVVLEPTGDPRRLTVETLELLLATCYRTTTYLDRYYSLHPGRLLGSKRLVVLLPGEWQERSDDAWMVSVAEYATLVFADSQGIVGDGLR